MTIKISIATFVLALGITSANAQTHAVAHRQHQRIRQGVKSGELTKTEAVHLRKDQKEIRHEKQAAKADGVVTKDEAKDIRKDQKQESRKIFRKKHNERERN
ncbi:MAG: hypothetical protein ABIU77_14295 [Ferruginibacter sp.]